MTPDVLLLLVLASGWATFAASTGLGSRRRGSNRLVATLVGAAFPVSWVAWFVTDNRAAGRRAFRAS